jgi:hypothetical protein
VTAYKFEVVIQYSEDVGLPTKDDLDLGALYYGDKHADNYSLSVVPGTIEEIEK